MADWLEHSVQVEVDAPIDLVWSLWADLEQMPRWMKWIESVTVEPDDPSMSHWTLNAGGWEFKWSAKIVKTIPNQIIEWESTAGLTNRGAVRFYDRKEGSIVKLSIAYDIPGVLGQLMDNLFLGKAVEDTLNKSLAKFQDYVTNLPKEPKP